MSNVDELFKSRYASTSSTGKRKLESPRNPEKSFKSARISLDGDVKGHRNAQADDGDVEDDQEIEAGPEPPPEGDNAAEEEDDEEGRFFGAGVTEHTADVLDYIDDQDGESVPPERIDAQWLRRTALNFERRLNRNAELRAKFEDDPAKFMESEGDLDADIKSWSILSEHPNLYPEFVRLGCVNSLVSLLAHENTDIAINAIEILTELTDEDIGAEQNDLNALLDAALEADLPEVLVQNFSRLDESNEVDRAGVYHSLSLLENLVSQTETLEKMMKQPDVLLKWLFERIQSKESPVSQNKQFAVEVLAIILQSSAEARSRFIALNGVDIVLQLLAVYRKVDPPKDSEAEEYAEELFDILTSLVEENPGKAQFRESEGIELTIIMLKEGGKLSKPRALRVLNHALTRAALPTNSGESAHSGLEAEPVALCEGLVGAKGLKPLFSIFAKSTELSMIEHVLGILASMLRFLPGDGAARIRTLAKFVEKNYQPVERLVQLRREYAAKLAPVDAAIADEQTNPSAAEVDLGPEYVAATRLSRRLDAGLSSFQTIDVILAWLVAEDKGAKAKLESLLRSGGKNEQLGDIKATLKEQLGGLNGSQEQDDIDAADMLQTLILCLEER